MIWIIIVFFALMFVVGFIDAIRNPATAKPHFKQHLTGEIKFIEYRFRKKNGN